MWGHGKVLEKTGVDLDIEMAISLIQFTVKLDIMQETTKEGFKTLIREEIQSGREMLGCTE